MSYKLRDLDKLNAQIKSVGRIQEVMQNIYGIEIFPMADGDFKALCPFHEEKTPSFGIKNSKQVYHCFGCKEGGDIISLVQKMDNVEYIDALITLAEHYNIDLTVFKTALTEDEKRNLELYKYNEQFADECEKDLDDFGAEWLKRRRFKRDVLRAFKIGYALKAPREIDPHSLDLDRRGMWENVVVVPQHDVYGRICGFRNRMQDPNATVKVIGPKKEHPLEQPLFYGLYQARKYIRNAGYLILVEGEADVWQMASHGYRNVAATMGTKLNAPMLAVLDALSINRVILLADNDEAGRTFSKRVAEDNASHKISIKIARLMGDGKDPDEVLLASGPDKIGEAIAGAKYAFEHYLMEKSHEHDLDSTTGKLEFIEEVKHTFVPAPTMVKELACRMIATMTNTSYEVILDLLRETDNEHIELHNTLGERIVLKAMLQNEDIIGEVLLKLKHTDFYLRKHSTVYEIIADLYRRQKDVNADVLKTILSNKGVGDGNAIVMSIMSSEVDTSSYRFMLDDLRDKSVRRSIQTKATEAAQQLSNTKMDAISIVRGLGADIAKAVVGTSGIHNVSDVVYGRVELMHARIKDRNPIIGIDLGPDFQTINNTIHGLQTKRYVVLAAPSGAGKTAVACVLAKRISVDLGIPSTFFTFETGVETITDRIISNISGISSEQFLTGYIRPDDIERVQDAATRLASSPLVITERGMVFEEFASIVRHDVLSRGTKVVFLDYIQLMELQDNRGMNKYAEVGKISRGLLELAKELDICVVAVAQQNRDAVKNNSANKEGIGDSYKISQDCDMYVVFREKTKEEMQADGPEFGNRVLILDKHRHGRAGIVCNFLFDSDVMRFVEAKKTPVRQ